LALPIREFEWAYKAKPKSERMTARNLFFLASFCIASIVSSFAQGTSSSLSSTGQSGAADASGCSLASGGDSLDCASGSSSSSTQGESIDGGSLGLGGGFSTLGLGGTIRNVPQVYRDNAGEPENANGNTQTRLLHAKPQPLTEFQTLVAGSVGHIVPIYGADLFTEVPDTFAPVQRIPVGPDYTIGPGDEILIRTWGQISQNLHLTVDRSGSIYIPQVGEVHVAGLQFGQLQDFIKSHYAYVFRNFDLNVNLGQLRSIQVFLTGEAQRPGSYTISSLSTLVNAVFACGGPTIAGSLRHIELKRGSSLVADFDLYDLLLRGDKSKDTPLQSGDVIYFPPAGPRVAVVGSVQVPAIYELRGAESVDQALALAGGISSVANSSSLEIERTEAQPGGVGARVAMDVTMNSAGLALKLVNADLIRVRARAPRFARSVTLRGNVANPGRFAWHEGMRIRDLIPDQESLLTQGYWLRREQLGLPVADYQPMMPPLNAGKASQSQENPAQSGAHPSVVPQDQQTLSVGLFPQLTQGEPTDAQSSAGPHAQLGSLAASADTASDATAGQVVQVSTSASEPATLGSGPRLVTSPHFPIETQVVRTSPNIDWSYAVVERVEPGTLTTKLIPFNLGAVVVDHDENADFDLEPGDVITVFSDADIRVPRAQQTKYVRLEGEFVHASSALHLSAVHFPATRSSCSPC
jgi:polysaccharide biosynthesis/export protein